MADHSIRWARTKNDRWHKVARVDDRWLTFVCGPTIETIFVETSDDSPPECQMEHCARCQRAWRREQEAAK